MSGNNGPSPDVPKDAAADRPAAGILVDVDDEAGAPGDLAGEAEGALDGAGTGATREALVVDGPARPLDGAGTLATRWALASDPAGALDRVGAGGEAAAVDPTGSGAGPADRAVRGAGPKSLLHDGEEAESDDTEAVVPHALLDEQRFLVRSLQDLAREREAGDIDEDDYQALRSRYAARLAVVTRSIERATLSPVRSTPRGVGRRRGGRGDRGSSVAGEGAGRRGTRGAPGMPGASPEGAAGAAADTVGVADRHAQGNSTGMSSADGTTGDRPAGLPVGAGAEAKTGRATAMARGHRRARRRWLVGGAVGCFALAAVVLVVMELGVRLPGQTVTGSITLSKQQRVQRLTNQGETALIEGNDTAAVVAFDEVLAIDPHQVEALSEAGWLQFAAGVEGHRAVLVRRGQRDEAEAVAAAPSSFAPRFYYGAMLAQEHDFDAAVAQFDAGLADHPPSSTVSVFVTTITRTFDAAHVPVPADLPPPTSS